MKEKPTNDQWLLTANEIREIAGIPEGNEYDSDSHIHTGQMVARAQAEHLIRHLESRAILIYAFPPYDLYLGIHQDDWESLRREVEKAKK